MSIGKRFLAAVVAKGVVSELQHYGSIEHLFRGNEIPVWDFVHTFVTQYGAIPTSETIQTHTGEELPEAPEPAGYYLDLLNIRHIEFELKVNLKKAQAQLMPGGDGATAALATVTSTALDLIQRKHQQQVADLREAYDLLVPDYVAKHLKKGAPGLMLGWPYLDEMTGGLVQGDLISYIGRPSMGKTFQMLYGAHHAWKQAELDPNSPGLTCMFVSMEMNVLAIEQRLAAMHTHFPVFKIKNAKLSSVGYEKWKLSLKALKGYKAPFWVVDGNLTVMVSDVVMLARQLKPNAIWVDGAYLMQHQFERDRYRRVALNVDLLKQAARSLGVPIVCSWQFAKTAAKKKKGEEVGMEDIAFSDAIPQNSSLVLGLFEDDTVETLKQRLVKVLKGRNGETGEFRTKWNFDSMDFGQVAQVNLDDLQF